MIRLSIAFEGALENTPSKVFEGVQIVMIGREADCHIQLPQSMSTVSRRHCVLEIMDGGVTITDFGSKNGTYVDGREIGHRKEDETPEQGRKRSYQTVALKNHSVINLGGDLKMRVSIQKIAGESAVPDRRLAPAPGELIAGYRKVGELGEGGMSVVYLVEETGTGNHNQYALKVMKPGIRVSRKAEEMFLREAHIATHLRNERVVRSYHCGYASIGFVILLEYCREGSLDQYLQRKGHITVREALDITMQILDALDYVHHAVLSVKLKDGSTRNVQGIVHRDLKPQNIFVSNSGHGSVFKVADFGLSKTFETAGLTGVSLTADAAGTCAYMCRQQFLNFKYAKPEVDVWAAAAILYNMLTGSFPKPLDRFLPHAVQVVILTQPCVPIRDRNPNIPQQLAEVIDRALDDGADRVLSREIDVRDCTELYYQSARELKRDLEKVYQDL